MKKNHLEIVLENGYVQSGYGYRKIIGSIHHWITFYPPKIQMYAYDPENPEDEKEYDSGLVELSEENLETFIKIFNKA